ncbi:dihydroorotate dehydrogenase (fumarate) [Batrachochytrium dendrobatidis JEL423]|uniref:Dihydroorotate dehydrogenase (quinone), mitochondrial n=1 Tax=Batrachochytrium dendrobatidis (strain JEL423) TaxID=403673 RepID=A0A177W6S7_BATDL|nr:dihydroorotate dehydrogenase (fumarate) [Batrachochytrium dendrobatidis JEL423]
MLSMRAGVRALYCASRPLSAFANPIPFSGLGKSHTLCVQGRFQYRLMSTTQQTRQLDPIDPVGPILTVLGIAVGLVGGVLGYVYIGDTRASIYKWLVMPALHHLTDPEESHKLSIWLAKHSLVPMERTNDDGVLGVEIWNKRLTNPLGLAAGYDKNAEAVDALFGFGFGMVEIGSVTPQPQPGNPKPRMFRLLKDKAVINRYGFNSQGHQAIVERLHARIRKYLFTHHITAVETETLCQSEAILSPHEWMNATSVSTKDAKDSKQPELNRSLYPNRLLGINLGKNKISNESSDQDYIDGIATFSKYADYMVINISSPNTPGLRSLQRRESIERLLMSAKRERDALPQNHQSPLVVKISPDLNAEELKDIADVVMHVGMDGVIISNTTISRSMSLRSDSNLKEQTGGLSGAPILPLSLHAVSEFYKFTQGRIPIIGCGGIQTGEDAINFAKAGATVIQVYTALGYQGPGLVHDIKREATEILKREGKTWSQMIGSNHNK